MMPYTPTPSGTVAPGGPTLSDEELLQAVVSRGENAANKQAAAALLFFTAVLFVGLGGLRWGWQTVIYLAVAVALHELGHVIAMRLCGYKNVRMLFLPLLGGLATGEPRELDATRNALVSLAGPVFGLFTTLLAAVAALWAPQPAALIHFAWISLVLNAINLLPLVPLDGGQFTNDALFSRYPVLELIFRVLAIVGLAWLADRLHVWTFGLLAGFMCLTTGFTYRRARLICDARLDPVWQSRSLDLETIRQLREMVTRLFAKVAPSKYQKALPSHVHGLWLEIRKRFPDLGETIALMVGYVACLISVAVIAVFLVYLKRRFGG